MSVDNDFERLAYSPEKVAALLSVSVSTIYRMVYNGTLPHKRILGLGRGERGRIVIPVAGLEKWLSKPDEPRQAALDRKAKEIAKGAVSKLRRAR